MPRPRNGRKAPRGHLREESEISKPVKKKRKRTSPRPVLARRAATDVSKKRPRGKGSRRRSRAEQPLGVGVGDPFAIRRLRAPARLYRSQTEGGVREVGWAEFGEIARLLAEEVGASFRPDVVLGVIHGGVFLGGALAASFAAEFRPVQVRKRGKRSVAESVGSLTGKTVLAVDDVTVTGTTLGALCSAAREAGARELRTATLVSRPGRFRPDFTVFETSDIVVFGWDYRIDGLPSASGNDPGETGV